MLGIISPGNNNKKPYIDLLFKTNAFKNKTKIKITESIDKYITKNTMLDKVNKDDIYELSLDEEIQNLSSFINEEFNREFKEDIFVSLLADNDMLFNDKEIEFGKLIHTSYRKYKSIIIKFIKANYDNKYFINIFNNTKNDKSIVVDIKTEEEVDLCDSVIVLLPVNQNLKLSNNKHSLISSELYVEKLAEKILSNKENQELIKTNNVIFKKIDNKISYLILNTNINKNKLINNIDEVLAEIIFNNSFI